MKNTEFVKKLNEILEKRTVYAKGTFGQKVDYDILNRKTKQYPEYYTYYKVKNLTSLIPKNYHMFDCVGLIKAVLWGFPKTKYLSYKVPDFGDWNIKSYMHDIKNMDKPLEIGEIVFMNGHVGVYAGNNFVIEATPAFDNGVCKTNLHTRAWLGHGKLIFIDYAAKSEVKESEDKIKMKVLKKNVKGYDVTVFEVLMAKLGFYNGEIDTNFGPKCVEACNKFQTKYPECGTNGLPDSSFGPACWKKVSEMMC